MDVTQSIHFVDINIDLVANFYIGATSSGNLHHHKRKCVQSYADASEQALLSPEIDQYFTACAAKD